MTSSIAAAPEDALGDADFLEGVGDVWGKRPTCRSHPSAGPIPPWEGENPAQVSHD